MRTLLDRKNEEKGVAIREPFELPFWGNPFPFMRRLTEEIDRAFGTKPGFLGLTEPVWVAGRPISRSSSTTTRFSCALTFPA